MVLVCTMNDTVKPRYLFIQSGASSFTVLKINLNHRNSTALWLSNHTWIMSTLFFRVSLCSLPVWMSSVTVSVERLSSEWAAAHKLSFFSIHSCYYICSHSIGLLFHQQKKSLKYDQVYAWLTQWQLYYVSVHLLQFSELHCESTSLGLSDE